MPAEWSRAERKCWFPVNSRKYRTSVNYRTSGKDPTSVNYRTSGKYAKGLRWGLRFSTTDDPVRNHLKLQRDLETDSKILDKEHGIQSVTLKTLSFLSSQ